MLISLVLGSSALALAPDDSIHIGQEPSRILRTHPERQHVLRHSEGWQAFLSGEGRGWEARFDEHAETIHRAWGPGIELGPLESMEQVEAALRDFLARNPGLIGEVSPEDLQLGRSGYDPRSDTWYVQLDRSVSGVPVWRSAFTARIKLGRLIMIGAEVYPEADTTSTAPALSDIEAISAAIDQGPAPSAPHTDPAAALTILPYTDGSGVGYRLCWEVRTRTIEPIGHWVSFVDAQTGELVNVHNEVRFLSGDLLGEHHIRSPDDSLITSVLEDIEITGEGSTTTDSSGGFSLSGTEATAELRSDGLRMHNEQGSDAFLRLTDGTNTWTDSDASQAEIDSYVFLHEVRAWADEHAPHINSAWSTVDSYVNINNACNAYWDGTVNFYRSGSGCNNTGEIADVNYHEWGHGFHYYNLQSGSFDSSISEGIGDSISFFLTEDSVIAPGFYSGGGGIREVSSDRVYPDDWSQNDVHSNGLIFGGAVWDLWGLLREGYDDQEEADAVMFQLFVDGLRGGPGIPETYDEFLVADDNNGDLSDGTPHQCYLMDAFGRHGLGPGNEDVSTDIVLTHTPLPNQSPAAASYDVTADIINYGELCGFSVESTALQYSTDGGQTWQEVSMPISGEATAGSIPAQPAGTKVLYYLQATADDGSQHYSPDGGEITPLSFYVGELIELYCEGFEDGDGDYTSELIAGEDQTGANDWAWGTPEGDGGDPDFASSGDNVWGNDLGGTIDGQQYNGEYQSDKQNRLSSPSIDLQGYDQVVVQFQRWLNVEDGDYDQARVLINDETAWQNHESGSSGSDHHQDSQWALHTEIIDASSMSEMVIGWEIESDGGLNFGGWNIDDVCVYGIGAGTGPGNTSDTGISGADTGLGGDGVDGWTYGCGCASAGDRGAGGLLAGLLLAGLALLRRRQD